MQLMLEQTTCPDLCPDGVFSVCYTMLKLLEGKADEEKEGERVNLTPWLPEATGTGKRREGDTQAI